MSGCDVLRRQVLLEQKNLTKPAAATLLVT